MNCPDTETLIAFAMNPLAAENGELAEHIRGCADCRLNLRLVNDTLLAADWKSPDKPADVAKALRLPPSAGTSRQLASRDENGPADKPAENNRVEDYIRVLDKDVKTPSGVWLRKGSKVLVDPQCPDRYEKATDSNISSFIARGFSFLRNLANSCDTLSTLYDAQNEVCFFGSAIDRNVSSLVSTIIPAMNLPVWVNFVPWPLKLTFGKCTEIKFEHDCFVKWMVKHGKLPKEEEMSPSTWRYIIGANFFRVYELRRASIVFRVYAIYATPIDPVTLEVQKLDVGLYRDLKEFVREWASDHGKVNCKCFILGAPKKWDGVCPVLLSDSIDVICSRDHSKTGFFDTTTCAWEVFHQHLYPFRSVFRNFVYALYPETEESRISRICKLIDGGMLEGSITSSKVAAQTGIPVELVERAFDEIQGDGTRGYENYYTERGECAIRRTSRNAKPMPFRRTNGGRAWQYAKGVLLLFAFAGEYARQFVASGSAKMGLSAICASVLVITYVQSCFEGFFKRQLEK